MLSFSDMFKHFLFSALHCDRIAFLKTSYLDEKKSMLNQYHKEIQTYKERKIKAHVELECVFYGLESIADNDREKVHDRHLKKVDDVKSGVSLQNTLFYSSPSENHCFVEIVIAIGFGSFC